MEFNTVLLLNDAFILGHLFLAKEHGSSPLYGFLAIYAFIHTVFFVILPAALSTFQFLLFDESSEAHWTRLCLLASLVCLLLWRYSNFRKALQKVLIRILIGTLYHLLSGLFFALQLLSKYTAEALNVLCPGSVPLPLRSPLPPPTAKPVRSIRDVLKHRQQPGIAEQMPEPPTPTPSHQPEQHFTSMISTYVDMTTLSLPPQEQTIINEWEAALTRCKLARETVAPKLSAPVTKPVVPSSSPPPYRKSHALLYNEKMQLKGVAAWQKRRLERDARREQEAKIAEAEKDASGPSTNPVVSELKQVYAEAVDDTEAEPAISTPAIEAQPVQPEDSTTTDQGDAESTPGAADEDAETLWPQQHNIELAIERQHAGPATAAPAEAVAEEKTTIDIINAPASSVAAETLDLYSTEEVSTLDADLERELFGDDASSELDPDTAAETCAPAETEVATGEDVSVLVPAADVEVAAPNPTAESSTSRPETHFQPPSILKQAGALATKPAVSKAVRFDPETTSVKIDESLPSSVRLEQSCSPTETLSRAQDQHAAAMGAPAVEERATREVEMGEAPSASSSPEAGPSSMPPLDIIMADEHTDAECAPLSLPGEVLSPDVQMAEAESIVEEEEEEERADVEDHEMDDGIEGTSANYPEARDDALFDEAGTLLEAIAADDMLVDDVADNHIDNDEAAVEDAADNDDNGDGETPVEDTTNVDDNGDDETAVEDTANVEDHADVKTAVKDTANVDDNANYETAVADATNVDDNADDETAVEDAAVIDDNHDGDDAMVDVENIQSQEPVLPLMASRKRRLPADFQDDVYAFGSETRSAKRYETLEAFCESKQEKKEERKVRHVVIPLAADAQLYPDDERWPMAMVETWQEAMRMSGQWMRKNLADARSIPTDADYHFMFHSGDLFDQMSIRLEQINHIMYYGYKISASKLRWKKYLSPFTMSMKESWSKLDEDKNPLLLLIKELEKHAVRHEKAAKVLATAKSTKNALIEPKPKKRDYSNIPLFSSSRRMF